MLKITSLPNKLTLTFGIFHFFKKSTSFPNFCNLRCFSTSSFQNYVLLPNKASKFGHFRNNLPQTFLFREFHNNGYAVRIGVYNTTEKKEDVLSLRGTNQRKLSLSAKKNNVSCGKSEKDRGLGLEHCQEIENGGRVRKQKSCEEIDNMVYKLLKEGEREGLTLKQILLKTMFWDWDKLSKEGILVKEGEGKKGEGKKGEEKKGEEQKGEGKKGEEKKGEEQRGEEKKGGEKKGEEKKGEEKKTKKKGKPTKVERETAKNGNVFIKEEEAIGSKSTAKEEEEEEEEEKKNDAKEEDIRSDKKIKQEGGERRKVEEQENKKGQNPQSQTRSLKIKLKGNKESKQMLLQDFPLETEDSQEGEEGKRGREVVSEAEKSREEGERGEGEREKDVKIKGDRKSKELTNSIEKMDGNGEKGREGERGIREKRVLKSKKPTIFTGEMGEKIEEKGVERRREREKGTEEGKVEVEKDREKYKREEDNRKSESRKVEVKKITVKKLPTVYDKEMEVVEIDREGVGVRAEERGGERGGERKNGGDGFQVPSSPKEKKSIENFEKEKVISLSAEKGEMGKKDETLIQQESKKKKLLEENLSSFFSGKSVVVTGQNVETGFPSRAEMQEIVKKNGGLLRTAVSGKTNFLLTGKRDPGKKKVEKANIFGCVVMGWEEALSLLEKEKDKILSTESENAGLENSLEDDSDEVIFS